ncbi:MAG: STAS domain-containing protein [Phycisphaerae bacterium]
MIFRRKPIHKRALGTVEDLGDGRVFYRLKAGMNFTLVPLLRTELLEIAEHYHPRKMIFELEQLSCFSGACLATLVEVLRHLPAGAQLYLAHVNKEFRGIIKIGHLDEMVKIVDDMPVQEAMELLAGSSCAIPPGCAKGDVPACATSVRRATGGADASGH